MITGRTLRTAQRVIAPGEAKLAASLSAAVLAGLSALHFLWATGCTWPAADAAHPADTVAGTDQMPGPASCVAVGCALAGSAAAVGGVGEKLIGARALRGTVAGTSSSAASWD
jgi:hypothetical protein